MARGDTRPIIGITSVPLTEFGVISCFGSTAAHSRAIERAGGAPIYLSRVESEETLRTIYEQLSGLLLAAGWPDVCPELYAEERHSHLGPTDMDTDRVDLTLAEWALEDDKPVLGICRGLQVLNVAMGGSLYQDIATECDGALDHVKGLKLDWSTLIHGITIEPGSRLSKITGETGVQVNSLHHLAIKRLGQGLAVAATSPDGVVEAVESPGHSYVVAAQFHPEELFQDHDWALHIFQSFVEAAAEFQRDHR